MEEHRKQGYLTENFRLFHLSSPGGTGTEFHYHEFCKLLLVVEGRGSYFLDGRRYHIQAGDILLVGDGLLHRPELDREVPYERIILYISPEFLRSFSRPDGQLHRLFFRDRPLLRLPENRRSRIFDLARGLEKDLSAPGFGRELLGQTGVLRLLVELGRCQPLSAQAQEPESPRIREILSYIDGHLGEDLDIQQIADRFFISRYHMMRLFRQETGTTIHQYLTQKRLSKARSLIQDGMKATEACYRCGWRSYSSFTRAAEKHLGTTPTGRREDGDVQAPEGE